MGFFQEFFLKNSPRSTSSSFLQKFLLRISQEFRSEEPPEVSSEDAFRSNNWKFQRFVLAIARAVSHRDAVFHNQRLICMLFFIIWCGPQF